MRPSSVLSRCGVCRRASELEPDPHGNGECPYCKAVVRCGTACDVFVSFASEDEKSARDIVVALTAAGISAWLAPDRLSIGADFEREIFYSLQSVSVLVLVWSRASSSSRWVEKEVHQADHNNCLIFPLRIEEFTPPDNLCTMALRRFQRRDVYKVGLDVVMREVIESVHTHLRRRALGDQPVVSSVRPRAIDAPLAGVDPAFSPYVGPVPFSERMADRFFGRQRDAENLLSTIGRSRMTLLYAPSGAGKSSLLNTLITVTLQERGFDVLHDLRVGGALPTTARAAEVRNVFTFSALCGLLEPVVPDPDRDLLDGLRRVRRKPGAGRVLIFDQFEEIFTQHAERFEDRAGFMADLVAALQDDPTLRVVFAMRQEYLADMTLLEESLPPAFTLERMLLRRLGRDGALEAITRPAEGMAVYGDGVAEAIVGQLNLIRVQGFDHVIVEKTGEFIELVHLQIVCNRLWRCLPAGITRIEREHLELAAKGQTFNEFVIHALSTFYDETVTKVAEGDTTQRHGGYSAELIRLGMMKFVTRDATRTMVPRANGRVGRLPEWIIEQLENEHLIRFEQRGGERWYELSHDLLAGPVGRQMDRGVSSLLFASDLLARVHGNVVEERRGSEESDAHRRRVEGAEDDDPLRGYFGEHRDVLAECAPFCDRAGLFKDEAEFLFRASLRSGQQMHEWSRRLGQDYPDVRIKVLNDGLAHSSADVRRHVVELLGTEPVPELTPGLVEVALGDADPGVSRAASLSLARLDQAPLLERLEQALDVPDRRAAAITALTRIRIAADGPVEAPVFDRRFAALGALDRRRIVAEARATRLAENLAVLAFVFVPTATLASISAGLYKWLPSTFNWSNTQATPSFAMGIFQGIVAGVIWAGLINVSIAFYHVVFGNEHRKRSMLRPAGAVLCGALGGVVSSAIIVLLVAGVFAPEALVDMGWITTKTMDRYSPAFMADVFVRTRLGWVDLITGTGLGIGIALASNGVRASTPWKEFIGRERRVAGVSDAWRAARDIAWIVLPNAWPIPLVVFIAAAIAFTVPAPAPGNPQSHAHAIPLVQGLIGDCTTQVIGGFWGLVGMGVGLVVMRSGFHIDPRRDQN